MYVLTKIKPQLLFLLLLLLALSYGLVGFDRASNHGTYIPYAIRMVDDTFLVNDWWMENTTHYHKSFFYLVYPFVGDHLKTYLALLNFLVIAGGLAALLYLFRDEDHGAALFITLLFLLKCLQPKVTLGVSYIFSAGLQPSSIGAAFTLWGIVFFLKRQWLYSGIAIALSGVFHANFVVAAFPIFGFAHILAGHHHLTSRLLKQLAPSLIVIAAWLPIVLGMGEGQEAFKEEAYAVFKSAVALHYDFASYSHYAWGFAGWTLVSVLAWYRLAHQGGKSGSAATPTDQPMGQGTYFSLLDISTYQGRFAVLFLAFLAAMVTNGLILAALDIEFINRLFMWRMAPFALLLGLVPITQCLVDLIKADNPAPRPGLLGSILLLLAIGLIYIDFLDGWKGKVVWLAFAFSAAVFLALTYQSLLAQPVKKAIQTATPAALCVLLLAVSLYQFSDPKKHSLLLSDFQQTDVELYDWARATPPGTVFMAPPSMADFQIETGRALPLTWKALPFVAEETVEWAERMRILTGSSSFSSAQDLDDAYARQPLSKLRAAAQFFKADFAIFIKGTEAAELFTEKLFENDTYIVVSTDTILEDR